MSLTLSFISRPKGPCIWKLNTSLLEDRNYVDKLTGILVKWINDMKYIENKNFVWDYLKYETRKFSIHHGKQKKRMQKAYEVEL